MMRTIYQILGLPTSTTEAELKTAYRKELLKAHPDNGGDADRLIRLINAYDNRADAKKQDPYIWTKPGEAKFHNMFADRRI